ncbi:MAG: MFS transporter [Oscillospiraceae bacterium]|nr:MFS transporter [Oscillospiraceae bacterium]
MKKNTKIKIAVYAAGMFQMGNMGISPSLSKIAQEFPDVGDAAVQVLMTCPDILVIISTLLAGWLTSRVQWRWIASAGMGIYFLAGLCGYFFSFSFPILFLWAAMLGLGMGMFIPTMATVVNNCFTGDERGEVLGLQAGFLNIGGILLTVFGGLLSSITWRTNYLVYMPVIIVAICIATMVPPNEVKRVRERKSKGGIEPMVTVYCLLNFCFMLLYNVFPSNTAMLLHERGYANSEVLAGIANGLGMCGGLISALLFSRFVKRVGESYLTIAFVLAAVGMGLGLIPSLFTLMLGAILAGAGVSISFPTAMYSMGKKFREDRLERSSSIFIAVAFTGGFCSSIVITPLAGLFAPTVAMRLIVAGVLAVVFGLCSVPLVSKLKRMPELRD